MAVSMVTLLPQSEIKDQRNLSLYFGFIFLMQDIFHFFLKYKQRPKKVFCSRLAIFWPCMIFQWRCKREWDALIVGMTLIEGECHPTQL